MTSPAQFRPQPPIALAGAQWAADYNEIKELGGKSSSKRSARQTEDARFWLITGPQSTDPIVRQLRGGEEDEPDRQRTLHGARPLSPCADAYIAVLDAKYHYDFWRPITAIRNGDMRRQSRTERDATWQPIERYSMPAATKICLASGVAR